MKIVAVNSYKPGMFKDETRGAHFSQDRDFRFVLWRKWDDTKPLVMFVGLNPSTANEKNDDPTIRRVVRFARDWGYGGVYMLNLFPFVTAHPEELTMDTIPELAKNEWYFATYSGKVDKVIFAWGNFKQARDRAQQVISCMPYGYCLGKNKDGTPKHPLYIKADTLPVKFADLK